MYFATEATENVSFCQFLKIIFISKIGRYMNTIYKSRAKKIKKIASIIK